MKPALLGTEVACDCYSNCSPPAASTHQSFHIAGMAAAGNNMRGSGRGQKPSLAVTIFKIRIVIVKIIVMISYDWLIGIFIVIALACVRALPLCSTHGVTAVRNRYAAH